MPYAATLTDDQHFYYDWNTSRVLNPSEHTISATAQVQLNYEQGLYGSIYSIASTASAPPAQGPYPYDTFYGDGRAADYIIADIHLKSVTFNNNVLLAQDDVNQVTPPEFTWNPSTNALTASQPAAYLKAKNVKFTAQLCSSSGVSLTGSATMGYAVTVQANPNTTNPSTSQPDPTLTLYDNSSSGPSLCGTYFSVNATTALDNWVARYTETFTALNLYVKFTKIPTPTWSQVQSYANPHNTIGNTLYALVAGPTAPMVRPWYGVLDDACVWAARTADATTATTDLATGLYSNGTYK